MGSPHWLHVRVSIVFIFAAIATREVDVLTCRTIRATRDVHQGYYIWLRTRQLLRRHIKKLTESVTEETEYNAGKAQWTGRGCRG